MDNNLTIKEMFEYYGMLYTMSKTQVAKRINELSNFLKLPDFKSFIGELRYFILIKTKTIVFVSQITFYQYI